MNGGLMVPRLSHFQHGDERFINSVGGGVIETADQDLTYPHYDNYEVLNNIMHSQGGGGLAVLKAFTTHHY